MKYGPKPKMSECKILKLFHLIFFLLQVLSKIIMLSDPRNPHFALLAILSSRSFNVKGNSQYCCPHYLAGAIIIIHFHCKGSDAFY